MDVTKRMLAMIVARGTRLRATAKACAALVLAATLALALPMAPAAQDAAKQESAQDAAKQDSAQDAAQAGSAPGTAEEKAAQVAEGTTSGAGTAPVAGPAAAPVAPAPGAASEGGPVLGPETNLPLPRFVSLKAGESNVRRGPSLTHRIDWVFMRRDMPLRIVAEYGHWRRVVDREGLGGWMHYSLLSGTRTVIVDRDMMPLHSRPDEAAPQTALLENGVIARLGDCQPDWCQLTAGGYRGWARKDGLWGVEPDELRD